MESKWFLLGPTKMFSPKWRENWVGMNFLLIDKNAHVFFKLLFFFFFLGNHVASSHHFFPFLNFFYLLGINIASFFFSFDFLGFGCDSFFFFTRCDFFFWYMIFIFIINLCDCSFFVWLFVTFFILIGYHSLTRVYE